jgi:hypothetical protein
MKSPGVSAPVTTFAIPPLAPDAVAQAQAIFDRVCDQLGEAQGELADALDAINVSAKEAIAQDAAALVAGAKPKAGVVRQERETAIAKIEQKINTLKLAAHIAGNDLADAIGASKGEWVPLLEQAEAEAVEEYLAAIKAAQEAAATLGKARRAAEWVAKFNAGQAKIAGQNQFSGGTLRVRGTDYGAFRGEHMVIDVLKLCEQSAGQPEPKLVTSRVGK